MRPGRARTLVLGIIGKAHGIKGEVRVKTFLADPGDLAAYGPLTLPDGRLLTPVHVRLLRDDLVVARFKELSERTQAEAHNGQELTIARDKLPAPEEDDSFYHADLIGLEARLPDGTRLGEVIAIHNFGAGDILEVRGTDTQLFAFTKETVPTIDIAAGTLTLIPPLDAA